MVLEASTGIYIYIYIHEISCSLLNIEVIMYIYIYIFGKTIINHQFGNCLYNLFMVKLEMIYGIVSQTLYIYIYIHTLW